MIATHEQELRRGERFDFGGNWARFLGSLNEDRIAAAEQSLREMLQVQELRGSRFLDVGSGSGLFSLAARRLGARVHSFDFDPRSVACTLELRRRYFPDDADWTVEEGSVLDANYMASLSAFDVVYSWGVLHHTGDMWKALANVAPVVAPGCLLFIAVYNDQGWISRYWLAVKRFYNGGLVGRALVIGAHAPYLLGIRWLARAARGVSTVKRGMSLWHDMVDWVGGYPFEVARPEEILMFYRRHGFDLEGMVTCGGRLGCNEFVFRRRTSRFPGSVDGHGPA